MFFGVILSLPLFFIFLFLGLLLASSSIFPIEALIQDLPESLPTVPREILRWKF